jgi:hypothetical protein
VALKDPRTQLLERYVLADSHVSDELALLATMPESKQEIVMARLEAIHCYLSEGNQTPAEADAAAVKIGVARKQFYRLMAKLQELGPTRALSPGFRNVPRSAPSKDGLAEAAEAAVLEILRNKPDAKISEVESFVRSKCQEGGFDFPGVTAIRRRVHALRRSLPAPLSGAELGARLAVDQVALDLGVTSHRGTTLSVITLVIDRSTKLICGAGLTAGDGMGIGLQIAVRDSGSRLASFADYTFPVAANVQELTWVVPPGLEAAAAAISAREPVSADGPTFEVISAGPRRHGDNIMRLLGDRLGPHSFRRLAALGEDPPSVPGPGLHVHDAPQVVSRAVSQWNAQILAGAQKSEADPKRLRRLQGIADELARIYMPVFDGVHSS